MKADIENHVMWYIRTAAKIWGERDRSKVAQQYANYNDIRIEVYDSLGFGTPTKVRWMRDEGGVLMNFMGFGGLPRAAKLFAEEVMPRFKDRERPARAEGARACRGSAVRAEPAPRIPATSSSPFEEPPSEIGQSRIPPKPSG